jgi:hypothetical protein
MLIFWLLLVTIQSKIIYFIRHGEKKANSKELSHKGFLRAKCLKTLFTTTYPTPDRILAQRIGKYSSKRPIQTVKPLAENLGVKIELCEGDDYQCVFNELDKAGDVLVSWEHKRLSVILEHYVDKKMMYPKHRFDLIWIVNTKTRQVREVTQDCLRFF